MMKEKKQEICPKSVNPGKKSTEQAKIKRAFVADGLITINEAAQMYKGYYSSVSSYRGSLWLGNLPYQVTKVGRRVFVRVDDVRNHLNELGI